MRYNKIKKIKELLEKKGAYDSTPDTNIERLEKKIIDLSLESKKQPALVKEINTIKKKKKEKPINTSILYFSQR